MAENQAETGLEAANTPPQGVVAPPTTTPPVAAKSEPPKDFAVREYVKPSLIRYPMYDYKTGNQFYLSKTEQIVVDAYLETFNETEATRALNAIRGAHGSFRKYSVNAVKRWLRKPHVASYIGQKFQDKGKVNWMDAPKWEAWGVDVMQGRVQATQVQVAVWREFGKSKGWYKETGPQVMNNTQINFVQSDGKA